MPKKKANVLVTSRECRGNHERMIRRFIKKTKKEKIIEQIKDKRYYKKPSVKKREDRAKAERKRKSTVIPRYLDLAYLDINLRSRQKQSLFNIKLPGYLDISISTTRYLDIISNPLEEKLDI